MATILITGANRGIGLALAQLAKARGDRVIAVCRQPSPELESSEAEIVSGIEVTSDAAVATLARKMAGQQIDVLLANAGILRGDSLDTFEIADIAEQIEVNAVAPLRLVRALLPRLAPASKVALITSRMGSIADNGTGGYYGYRMSKAALNAAGVSLARDLRGRGIAVALLHPGYVRTDMTKHNGTTDPAEAAHGLLARIDELTLATSGSFWHANGEPLPW